MPIISTTGPATKIEQPSNAVVPGKLWGIITKISSLIKRLFELIKAFFARLFGRSAKEITATPEIDKKGEVGKTSTKVEEAVAKTEDPPKPVPVVPSPKVEPPKPAPVEPSPKVEPPKTKPVPRIPAKKVPEKRPDTLELPVETLKSWARKSKPSEMDKTNQEIKSKLGVITDVQLSDLFIHDAERMAQVLENHPASFADPDNPQRLAQIAASLFSSDQDREAKGMGNVLSEVFRIIESNPTEGQAGALSQQSLGQYYNILNAFAYGTLFHYGVEGQLIAIVHKINKHDFDPQVSPQVLGEMIHQLAVRSQSEFNARLKAEKEKPPVTPERKIEIQDLVKSTLSDTPKKNLYKLRADLTKIGKDGEMNILIETVTTEQLKNLWIFELNIDNRAKSPIPRLSQMFSNMNHGQFLESLTCNEFRLLIQRYPPAAAIGFTTEQLALLADKDDLEEALDEVYALVGEDKKKPLEEVHRRRQEFLEAKKKLQVKRVVKPEEVHSHLSAESDPIEAGRLIDDLPEEEFHGFIEGLGTGDLLINLWKVERKVMNAETDIDARRDRLGKIISALSADQVQASVEIKAFREIISNSTDRYAHKVAETMKDDHFAIIARHPDALLELSVVMKCCDKKRPNMFLILFSTIESMPQFSSVKNKEQGDAFIKLKIVIESFYATLGPPQEGWGDHGDKNNAVKRLKALLEEKSKLPN